MRKVLLAGMEMYQLLESNSHVINDSPVQF